MKISLDWLGDFIDWQETDTATIVERITCSSAEVEEIEEQGALLNHCCVGKILSLKKHPDADKLQLAEVETDKGKKVVVCGGTNLEKNMLVAFAHSGATVRHGKELVTLAPIKIRGQQSDGMICAAEELGLETLFPPKKEDGDRPVINLTDKKLTVAAPLKEALGMTDTVLHVSNKAIPHRADLFSHLGMARECVALGLAKWKKEPAAPDIKFEKAKIPFECIVDAPEKIGRYASCLIEIDELGQAPDWMIKRLEATGWRSLNAPIDITNYVAMELGMPLHSFDADDIKGDVHFRLAKKGEKIITLDKAERELPDGAIVLSDDEGIFDLMGIMGGLRSSTKGGTKRIYLHSASVDPVSIRKAIVATGHRTDASTVYEKGIPPMMAVWGLKRALELFLEYIPGCRIVSELKEWGDDGKNEAVSLEPERMHSLIGKEIDKKEMEKILSDLGCAVESKKDSLIITPPLWRKDLTQEADIAEEIGRIHGFDNIEPVMPHAPMRIPERDQRMHNMRDTLKEWGGLEVIPLSLVGPTLLKRAQFDPSVCTAIENPLGEEFSLMTPSLLPKLLEHAQENIRQSQIILSTFSVSHVFDTDPEHWQLALLHADSKETQLLTSAVLHVQHRLLHSLAAAGHSVDIKPSKNPPPQAHPGRVNDVLLNKKMIGHVFELHPHIADEFELPTRTACAVVDLGPLLATEPLTTIATSLPQFPSVSYDETVLRAHTDKLKTTLSDVRTAHELLEEVIVTDLYEGTPLKDGEYNCTLRFTYRSPDHTLTEDEAKKAHSEVMKKVK